MDKTTQNILVLALVAGVIYMIMHKKYMKKNCRCKDDMNGMADSNPSGYSGLDNAQYEVEGVGNPAFAEIGYEDPSAQFAVEALNATNEQMMTTQPFTGINTPQDFAEVDAIGGGFRMY